MVVVEPYFASPCLFARNPASLFGASLALAGTLASFTLSFARSDQERILYFLVLQIIREAAVTLKQRTRNSVDY